MTRVGGIVLCGGKSTRMGVSKATLPFGAERMLSRVVRLLSEIVHPIAVVTAPHQAIPPLPPETLVAHDLREERGPLEGLFAGMKAISPHVDAAYVTSCDVPLLVPAFVERMIELLGDHEIVVPDDGDFRHPLSAVYRTTLIDRIATLLAADRLRPVYLFDLADTRMIPTQELRDVDPDLNTLRNLNHPADYFAALNTAGLEPDPELKTRLQGQGE